MFFRSARLHVKEGGYENVPEHQQLTAEAPLGTISAWIPRNDKNSNDMLHLHVMAGK